MVRHAVECTAHHAVEQHEICAAGLDVDVAERVQHAIVKARRHALEPRHTRLVADPLCGDDLEASAPPLHQIGNTGWRVLKVGVHHDDCPTTRATKPGA